MSCTATVILPTYNHGETIRFALWSALRQTVQDIEIFVVCDGCLDISKKIVLETAATDGRVKLFTFPKNRSRGEINRHRVLMHEAKGKIVCYLCDRDLWFPHHIETALKFLKNADFYTSNAPVFSKQHNVFFHYGMLDILYFRKKMLDSKQQFNFTPFSYCAHTLEAYHRLPFGWRETPEGLWTDLYMWKQFLFNPFCTALTNLQFTGFAFPSMYFRETASNKKRLQELSFWKNWMDSEDPRHLLNEMALNYLSGLEKIITGLEIQWNTVKKEQQSQDHLSLWESIISYKQLKNAAVNAFKGE